jgi:hypothetical protein
LSKQELETAEWFCNNEVAVAARGSFADYEKAIAKRNAIRAAIDRRNYSSANKNGSKNPKG